MAKTRRASGSSASRRRSSGARGARRQGELNLKPLKQQIKKHIDKLSAVEKPGTKTRAALASLKRVQRDLTRACLPTMVIGFP